MEAVLAEKPLTADDLLALPADERYELEKGALIAMSPPPGSEHGSLANALAYLLTAHVRPNKLGQVFAAETGFRIGHNPDTVRAADVAFVSKARLPRQLPKGYLDIPPDIVAEIVSPSDDADRVQAKTTEWLEAGVQIVLVVYPGPRQIAVYHSLHQVIILTESDTVTLEPVLSGFSIPVSEIFA